MEAVSSGSFAERPSEEPYPGVERRSFDSPQATVTRYSFAPEASFPLHRHAQEQITLIEEGTLEVTVGRSRQELRAGDWSIIGPDVEHAMRAGPGGARFVAIVVPRRERSDAYTVLEGDPGIS